MPDGDLTTIFLSVQSVRETIPAEKVFTGLNICDIVWVLHVTTSLAEMDR